MFDKTITIFCHNHSDLGDTWFPYVIRGVYTSKNRGYALKTYGADYSDSIAVHIPYKQESDGIVIDGNKFLNPKEWDAVPLSEKDGKITLKGGQNFDFVYLGDYSAIGAMTMIHDNDYRYGFYDYFKKQFDDVYAVAMVSGPFTVIKHFELICR